MRKIPWFFFLCLSACSLTRSPNNPLLLLDQDYSFHSAGRIGMSFPPVNDAGQREMALRELNNLNVRKIRFAENWRVREKNQGTFDWTPLDERVDFFSRNNVSVLLTVQSDGPAWAVSTTNKDSAVFLNDTDFTNYVAALTARCGGKIAKIQFGNEWNSSYGYVGTKEQFTHFQNLFYTNVKSAVPGLPVVLGGISSGALTILAYSRGLIPSITDDHGKTYGEADRGEVTNDADVAEVLARLYYVLTNADYDAIDLHLYDDCENWPVYVNMVRSMFPGKEVVISEFGGPNPEREIYSDYYQSSRLYDYLKTLDSMTFSEAYFFKLVESSDCYHSRSGLLREFLPVRKPAYDVFYRMMHDR